MTQDEIQHSLTEIRDLAGDDENAHSAEDRLHEAVLQAIADGTCENPQVAASLALTSRQIKFARWCA